MAEYKCICCGETKESEKSCTCPNCGYKMYPTSYDRKQVLANEINSFVNHLKLEDFFTRLNKFREELKTHILEEYHRDYEAKYDVLKIRISSLDQVLKETLKGIGIEAVLCEPSFPSLVMDYREVTNEEQIDTADDIMEMLGKLSTKRRHSRPGIGLVGTVCG